MTTQPSHPSDAGMFGAAPPPACPAHADAPQLGGPGFHTDPAAKYREMRRSYGPVAPVLLEGGVPAWLVLGYRELHHVTSNSAVFGRDSRRWNAWGQIPQDWPLLPMIGYEQPSILYAEGTEHQRRSTVLCDALDGVDPFELSNHAEQLADRLIDEFCGSGEADLIARYAKLLPLLVLARIYGFSDEEGAGMVRASNAIVDGQGDALEGMQYMYVSTQQLVAARRAAPGNDVTSRMVTHSIQFGDEELIQDLLVLAVAGHQPTADWIGNTLRLMLTDERFAASLGGGRRSIGQAMNEVLWEDTPTQNVAGRWATRDTQLGGQHIRAGDLLLLGVAAANADPEVRPDAHSLPEGNSAFLSFGHGDHRCPYPAQEIAETIARTGVEVLLDRLPDVELAVPAQELTRRPSPWLRGMTDLPVRFSPVPIAGDGR